MYVGQKLVPRLEMQVEIHIDKRKLIVNKKSLKFDDRILLYLRIVLHVFNISKKIHSQ